MSGRGHLLHKFTFCTACTAPCISLLSVGAQHPRAIHDLADMHVTATAAPLGPRAEPSAGLLQRTPCPRSQPRSRSCAAAAPSQQQGPTSIRPPAPPPLLPHASLQQAHATQQRASAPAAPAERLSRRQAHMLAAAAVVLALGLPTRPADASGILQVCARKGSAGLEGWHAQGYVSRQCTRPATCHLPPAVPRYGAWQPVLPGAGGTE